MDAILRMEEKINDRDLSDGGVPAQAMSLAGRPSYGGLQAGLSQVTGQSGHRFLPVAAPSSRIGADSRMASRPSAGAVSWWRPNAKVERPSSSVMTWALDEATEDIALLLEGFAEEELACAMDELGLTELEEVVVLAIDEDALELDAGDKDEAD